MALSILSTYSFFVRFAAPCLIRGDACCFSLSALNRKNVDGNLSPRRGASAVFVSAYAYAKKKPLCEDRMTIVLLDSDDDNGDNLFFGFLLKR